MKKRIAKVIRIVAFSVFAAALLIGIFIAHICLGDDGNPAGIVLPVLIALAIGLVVSILLSKLLSKWLVQPLLDINPKRPWDYKDNPEYEEIMPLLARIAKQKDKLSGDKAEIENASLIRQEFTANVSHELKTPLHAISGYAELIENGMAKNGNAKLFASKIRVESGRLAALVEDIIDLQRLDGGGDNMRWEDCDLAKVAENAIDSLASTAAEKNVELISDLESAVIRGVPQHLYSIVYNLCDNAIKYNHEGGSVTIKVRSKAEGILLIVSDTGIGIPKESIDRIFERFYRIDKSRSRDVGGTGLGLSIVKHAVLVHNGSITVNSDEERGTEFVVVFPKL